MISKWVDVSVPLHTNMVHWPGDPAARIERVLDMEKGDECSVSKIAMGSHTGTHMDAPFHYVRGGAPLDRMPLDVTIGAARVVAIRDRASIKRSELERMRLCRGERILFKTANSQRCWNGDAFVEDFVSISLDAARFLAQRRVMLVGIDYLSVGGFKAGGASVHRALLEAGIWIIEGLNLSMVGPGRYQLVCLPLRIENSDGAPARALLRSLGRRAAGGGQR